MSSLSSTFIYCLDNWTALTSHNFLRCYILVRISLLASDRKESWSFLFLWAINWPIYFFLFRGAETSQSWSQGRFREKMGRLWKLGTPAHKSVKIAAICKLRTEEGQNIDNFGKRGSFDRKASPRNGRCKNFLHPWCFFGIQSSWILRDIGGCRSLKIRRLVLKSMLNENEIAGNMHTMQFSDLNLSYRYLSYL